MSTAGAMSVALLVLLLGVNVCCASRAFIDSEGTAGHGLVGSRHSVVPAVSEGEEIHNPVFYTYNARYDVEPKDGYEGVKFYGYTSKSDGHGRPGEVKDCGRGKEEDGNGKKKDEHNFYGYNGHGSKDDGKKDQGSNVDGDGKKKGGCKYGHDSKDGVDVRMRDGDSNGESKNYIPGEDWQQQAQAVPYKFSP